MATLPKNAILLAIDPTSRGFAFAVLEAPAFLVDWGSKSAPANTRDLSRKVDAIISRYKPDLIVLEDLAAKGARRRKRARREIGSIERCALKRGVRVERVSRLAILDALAPGKSKYEVALRLAEIYPVLANRLPRKRNTWRPEQARMSVFDAVGIAAATVERARHHSSQRPASPTNSVYTAIINTYHISPKNSYENPCHRRWRGRSGVRGLHEQIRRRHRDARGAGA